MTTFSLAFALAGLLLGPPREGPAAPGSSPGDADHHDAAARRLSFDESIGASASAPIVAGLEDAAASKRALDRTIPRLSQNPRVQVMPGARLNAGADSGFELQGSITQGWNLEGYGGRRRAAAAAETAVIEADARAEALERRFEAARAWIRLHGAERRLAIASANLELAEDLVETLELARAEGVATRNEVAEARATAAEAEATVVDLAGEVHDLGLALARETGTVATAPLATRGDYPNPELPPEDQLRAAFEAVEQLPAVALRRVEARAALARAEETERSRGAVLTTGASAQLESTGEVIVFGIIGSSIPVVDRNQRAQASARAEAQRAEAEAEQLAVELSAVLAIALHELRHTRERVELLRDKTLPAMDELVEARAAALALGEATRAELLAAQHRRSVVARELAAAEADWVWARVEAWLYLEALEHAAETEPKEVG